MSAQASIHKICKKRLQTETWFKKLPPKYKNFYLHLFDNSAGNGYITANNDYKKFIEGNKCRIHGLIKACNKDGIQRIVQIREGAWWIKHKYFHTFGFRYLPQVSAHRGAISQLIANNITYADLCSAGLLNEKQITQDSIKEDAMKHPRKLYTGKEKRADKNGSASQNTSQQIIAEDDRVTMQTVEASNTELLLTSNAIDAPVAAAKGTVELLRGIPGYSAPIRYRTDVAGLSENVRAFLDDPQYFIDFAQEKGNQISTVPQLQQVVQSFVNMLFSRRQPRTLEDITIYFTNWRAKEVRDQQLNRQSKPFFVVMEPLAIYQLSYRKARGQPLSRQQLKNHLENMNTAMNQQGYHANKYADQMLKEHRRRIYK